MGNSVVVQIVAVVALIAGSDTFCIDAQECGTPIALWTSQVIGIIRSITKIRLADDETGKAELEYAILYVCIGKCLFVSVGFFHLVSIFRRSGAYGEEVAGCLHLVER